MPTKKATNKNAFLLDKNALTSMISCVGQGNFAPKEVKTSPKVGTTFTIRKITTKNTKKSENHINKKKKKNKNNNEHHKNRIHHGLFDFTSHSLSLFHVFGKPFKNDV